MVAQARKARAKAKAKAEAQTEPKPKKTPDGDSEIAAEPGWESHVGLFTRDQPAKYGGAMMIH